MKIDFCPIRSDDTIKVTKIGDTLIFNDVLYDFTQVPEGATLPKSAIDCKWIVSDVDRVNGEITLTLLLPYGPDASDAAKFPQPLTTISDGIVEFPK